MLRSMAVAVISLVIAAQSSADDALRFSWPGKMKAQVDIRVSGSRSISTEGTTSWDFNGTYTQIAEHRGGELYISRTNFSGWKGKTVPRGRFIIDQIVDLVPAFVVSGDGSYRRVEAVDVARRNIESVFGKIDSMPHPHKQIFTNLASEAGLSAITQDYWSVLVEFWRNRSFGKDPIELVNTTAVPQLGGGSLDLKIRMTSGGPVPCNKADTVSRCVLLHSVSEPDAMQVAQILKKATNVEMRVTGYAMKQSLSLVADPKTLVPYRLSISRAIDTEMSMQGRAAKTSERNERVYTFTY